MWINAKNRDRNSLEIPPLTVLCGGGSFSPRSGKFFFPRILILFFFYLLFLFYFYFVFDFASAICRTWREWEIDDDYIQDDFNLTHLNHEVDYYEYFWFSSASSMSTNMWMWLSNRRFFNFDCISTTGKPWIWYWITTGTCFQRQKNRWWSTWRFDSTAWSMHGS